MTKWRPAGWERQFENISERDRFEAGADAILMALRSEGIHESDSNGLWVFIPDDTKEEHGHRP